MQLLRSFCSGVGHALCPKATTVKKRSVGQKTPLLASPLRAGSRKNQRPQLPFLGGGPEKDSPIGRERVVTRSTSLGLTHVGVQWLVGIGIFCFCLAAAIFLISAISTLKEVSYAARRVTIVMRLLELEMPETMAAMRLSSLEISDCIEEFTGLGSDLASGLRSSANVVSAAEKSVHQGTELIKHTLLPAIRSRAPEAKHALEEMLKERAMLYENGILSTDATQRPSHQLKAIRQGVSSLGVGLKAATVWKAMRGVNKPQSLSDSSKPKDQKRTD